MLERVGMAAASAAVALTLASCGADRETAAPSVTAPADRAANAGDGGIHHIHGLGVVDDTLFIATHSGLWAVPDGTTAPERIGGSRRDVMGFSVVEENRFIGSGHPEPGERAPANLGLIESRDRGRTWRTISLRGDADFHVLESSGSRIYGFDGTRGRLMVSTDRGRSWRQRAVPAPLHSLAIDPESEGSFIASTSLGLLESDDSGRRLRAVALRDPRAGLLAWPHPDRLLLVDGEGAVSVSADRGRSWRPVGEIGGRPAAFTATGDEIFAALTSGTVKRSTDGGRSWSIRAAP